MPSWRPCDVCKHEAACHRTVIVNEARYITSEGRHVCGLHDMMTMCPSVRMTDVPELVSMIAMLLKSNVMPYQVFVDATARLKEIVCLKNKP